MPGEASRRGTEVALDAISGRASVGVRNTYLALLTAAPNDQTTVGNMPEVAIGGYARQPVTWTVPVGDPSATSNSGPVVFGPFSQDPPNVSHCALVSTAAGTTGDFLFHWALDVPKDATANESIQFASGALVMTMD